VRLTILAYCKSKLNFLIFLKLLAFGRLEAFRGFFENECLSLALMAAKILFCQTYKVFKTL